MNKTAASLGLILAILYSSTALSEDPAAKPPSEGGPIPTTLFREDSRSPDIIFIEGFSSWGTNGDIEQHVLGYTSNNDKKAAAGLLISDGGSLFIPTSASRNWGLETWLKNRFYIHTPAPQKTYLYRIRATGNTYNTHDSILKSSEMLPEDRKKALRGLAGTYRRQAEWLVTERINIDQIEWAEEYEPVEGSRTGEVRLLRTIHNPRYIRAETRASAAPFIYTPSTTIPTRAARVFPSLFGTTLNASWINCARPNPRDKREINNEQQHCIDTRYAFTPLGINDTISPINGRIYTTPTPWHEKHNTHNKYAQEWSPSNCNISVEQYRILINCDASPPYPHKYQVKISAGGSVNTWVEQSCTFEAKLNSSTATLEIPTFAISVLGKGVSIGSSSYRYSVSDVFSGTGGWWSNIKVMPIYPLIRTAPTEPPTLCNWSKSDAWMNWKGHHADEH